MKVIAITGTPCTGKTALAKMLCNKLNFHYIGINKIIKKYKISDGYDKKRKCKVIDVEKLNKALISEISNIEKGNKHAINKKIKNKIGKINGIIIDSHLSHYLPKKYVDLCIVAKCNLKALKKRLQNRGYGKNKIRENLDSEIFDICRVEALEAGHNIIVVHTDKRINYSLLTKKANRA